MLYEKYNNKKRKFVQARTNAMGFLSKAVKEFYPSLRERSPNDSEFKKAIQFARRCHALYATNSAESSSEPTNKKKFCEPDGGRKCCSRGEFSIFCFQILVNSVVVFSIAQ